MYTRKCLLVFKITVTVSSKTYSHNVLVHLIVIPVPNLYSSLVIKFFLNYWIFVIIYERRLFLKCYVITHQSLYAFLILN